MLTAVRAEPTATLPHPAQHDDDHEKNTGAAVLGRRLLLLAAAAIAAGSPRLRTLCIRARGLVRRQHALEEGLGRVAIGALHHRALAHHAVAAARELVPVAHLLDHEGLVALLGLALHADARGDQVAAAS